MSSCAKFPVHFTCYSNWQFAGNLLAMVARQCFTCIFSLLLCVLLCVMLVICLVVAGITCRTKSVAWQIVL